MNFVVCLWSGGRPLQEEWFDSVILALVRALAAAHQVELVTLERVLNPLDDRELICAFGDEENAGG